MSAELNEQQMAAAELNIIMSELSVEDLRLIVSVFKNNTALQAASTNFATIADECELPDGDAASHTFKKLIFNCHWMTVKARDFLQSSAKEESAVVEVNKAFKVLRNVGLKVDLDDEDICFNRARLPHVTDRILPDSDSDIEVIMVEDDEDVVFD